MGARSDFIAMLENGRYADMRGFYEQLHQRTMIEFVNITDTEIMGKTLWWEDEELSLLFRLQRFDAHLRQHTIQAEKTLAQILINAGADPTLTTDSHQTPIDIAQTKSHNQILSIFNR